MIWTYQFWFENDLDRAVLNLHDMENRLWSKYDMHISVMIWIWYEQIGSHLDVIWTDRLCFGQNGYDMDRTVWSRHIGFDPDMMWADHFWSKHVCSDLDVHDLDILVLIWTHMNWIDQLWSWYDLDKLVLIRTWVDRLWSRRISSEMDMICIVLFWWNMIWTNFFWSGHDRYISF